MIRGSLVVFTCLLLMTPIVLADSLVTGGPYVTGDLIQIRGDTNFNTDNRVLVEVFPASFGPTAKYEPSMTGGSSLVVPVVKIEKGGFAWSANMSTTGWKPDQYMVRVEVIGKDYRESAILSLAGQISAEQNASIPVNSSVKSGTNIPATNVTMKPADEIGDQKQKEQTPPAPVSAVPAGTQKPEPTRKSPLSPVTIIISLVIIGIAAFRKKE